MHLANKLSVLHFPSLKANVKVFYTAVVQFVELVALTDYFSARGTPFFRKKRQNQHSYLPSFMTLVLSKYFALLWFLYFTVETAFNPRFVHIVDKSHNIANGKKVCTPSWSNLVFFGPHEFMLEAPFLRSWDFTVIFTTASTSRLEGSPIQGLANSHGPSLLTSVILRELVFQLGIAVAICRPWHKILILMFCVENNCCVNYCSI